VNSEIKLSRDDFYFLKGRSRFKRVEIHQTLNIWHCLNKLRYIGNTSLVLEKISDISKIEQKGGGV